MDRTFASIEDVFSLPRAEFHSIPFEAPVAALSNPRDGLLVRTLARWLWGRGLTGLVSACCVG
eukprot:4914827-Ditylum_brightwellii.AAC.1